MEGPATAPSSSPAQHSSWHSPVTYLFGGLAALLGLIFLAIFILSCTYLKLSDYLENRRQNERSDLEAAAGEADGGSGGSESGCLKLAQPVLEEKYLVIMAGQQKPTFLATPVSSRASSFGSKSNCSCSTRNENTETSEEENAKKKQECWMCRV
ncbi:Protein GLUTAMINE DUMPER 3 [Abeliophyllum distichum]|uniref:Protein GLUTAMINE DUMPER 3 n=1 Tax=Abeliophyllum distichum TaxID=126358 RepID=A0ABD1VBS2_9LAMI